MAQALTPRTNFTGYAKLLIGSDEGEALPVTFDVYIGKAVLNRLNMGDLIFIRGNLLTRNINNKLQASSTLSTCTVLITGHPTDSMQPSSETNIIFDVTGTTTAIADRSFVMATGSFDPLSHQMVQYSVHILIPACKGLV
ncbi:uncharacterized protein EI90DRAFT_3131039 [Cantharellus anzutake]|uniref:uncharacterized protein n=1 Tax=Cantharellus anzutake TaxID=1750568 RepID=UPI0019077A0A|nr:uncharacterized protein EI90DRAFT_3131039 [Cantharellus anzutake]KAF8322345.1 hypothetical protein EI90DRAFT_3131039 [Cantharellus anzutake]